jgi:hypothetical protein
MTNPTNTKVAAASETPTPRTGRALKSCELFSSSEEPLVFAEDMAVLERELTEAIKERDELRTAISDFLRRYQELVAMEKERDEARRGLDEAYETCASICDELQGECVEISDTDGRPIFAEPSDCAEIIRALKSTKPTSTETKG